MDDTHGNDNNRLFSNSSDLPANPQDENASVFASYFKEKSFEENVDFSSGLGIKPNNGSAKNDDLRLFASFLKDDDTDTNPDSSDGSKQGHDIESQKMQFFSLTDEVPNTDYDSHEIPDASSTNNEPDTNQINFSQIIPETNDTSSKEEGEKTNAPLLPDDQAVQSFSALEEPTPVIPEPELESDRLTDQAFPLFLRFKASDNISSVADAIREKNHKTTQQQNVSDPFMTKTEHPDQVSPTENVGSHEQANMTSSVEDTNLVSSSVSAPATAVAYFSDVTDSISLEDLNDFDLDQEVLSRPIFKPAPAPVEPVSEPVSLSIPDVFQQRVEQESVLTSSSKTTSPVEPRSAKQSEDLVYFEDTEAPVFVPLKTNVPTSNQHAHSEPPKEEAIPVFAPIKSERPGSIDTHAGTANERPGSKDHHPQLDKTKARPGTQEPSKSSSHRPVKTAIPSRSGEAASKNTSSPSSATERLISNRYTAAQQMGTIAPLPQRDIKSRKRSGTRAPIVIALLTIVMIVCLVALWSFFDLGSVLFGKSNVKVPPANSSITTVTTAQITSSESAVETSLSAVLESTTESIEATTEATTKATTEATTKATTEATTQATTKATTEATTKATTEATTKATTEATTKATTEATTQSTDKVPASFDVKISNGTSDQDTAIFDLNFKNTGSSSVSLVNGMKQITLTFLTDIEISSVTSDAFTFTAKEGKKNVFIGVPTSKDSIEKSEILTTTIYGKSSGASVGKYKVTYYVEYFA